jgi:methylmalonyl-CoA mutase N-terminal domain/subunit
VGVNGYVEGESSPPPTLSIDPEVETLQLASLAAVKRDRDDDAVRRARDRIRTEAADPTINLMPALIDAASSQVTIGESMRALESVFGTWYERSVV